jgi:hypothetical protein
MFVVSFGRLEKRWARTNIWQQTGCNAMTENKPTRVLRLFGREIPMPASRIGRIVLGVLLIFLGFLGFLPVLGFWMIPLGLLVLSHDLPAVRRWRRRLAVRFERRAAAGSARKAAGERAGKGA